MGEILGLGMSHALGMRPPAPRSGSYRFLERADTPEWAKDPANWPEGLKRELGDDEGKSYNIRHRAEVGAQDRKLRETLARGATGKKAKKAKKAKRLSRAPRAALVAYLGDRAMQ